MTDVRDHLMAVAGKAIAAGEGPRVPAPLPVNAAMISHWTEAIGDRNPLYAGRDAVAPPAMIQVWSMAGLDREQGSRVRVPVDDVFEALDEAGYTGVVATNCEHTYHRYLRLGESLTSGTRLTDMAGPKRTALGEGYFVTWNVTWYSDGEPVADMLFRLLKFRPQVSPASGTVASGTVAPGTVASRTVASGTGASGAGASEAGTLGVEASGAGASGAGASAAAREPYPLRPAMNRDTAFFWDGVREGELRIQRCGDCGELRHPPGPVCPSCRSAQRTYTVAGGSGTVYSYVVHHNPPVPGWRTPFVVAVVELPEGVRMVGNIVDFPVEDVYVGMPVRVTYRAMDDELILPMWTPGEA